MSPAQLGITDKQVDVVIERLLKGKALRWACEEARVDVNKFRELRQYNREVTRRVDSARVTGLHNRAARCRFVVRTTLLSSEKEQRLLKRAAGYDKRAAMIE